MAVMAGPAAMVPMVPMALRRTLTVRTVVTLEMAALAA